ncbi:MAG: hypothetical protein EXR02_01985 [Rhodospirillales bacterium]|nr:hypothetical protein [Rhodospirillales bacterium]MSP79822.1 hypothetical protein [Rhodospirillales bacterium]
MANPKHLELARQGKDAWNKWRKENPDEAVDFSGTYFALPEDKEISFAGFEFGNKTSFVGAIFGNGASFIDAAFGDGADFTGAAFERSVFSIMLHWGITRLSIARRLEDWLNSTLQLSENMRPLTERCFALKLSSEVQDSEMLLSSVA